MRTKFLAAIQILLLLLFSTKTQAADSTHSEWIFQIRSESGFLLSPGLLSLKKNNSGQEYFFSACDFFQFSGAITASSDSGCLITTLDDRQLFINAKGGFEGKKKIFSVLYENETPYIAQENLTALGYSINIESVEMLVSINHKAGLPVDKKNQLLSEPIIGKQKEIRLNNPRENFHFNRVSTELYTSPHRKGSVVEGDFDLLGGELIAKNCDVLCLNFINWTRRWRKNGTTYSFYAGNYDAFYFPGKYDRLKEAAVVEVNSKSTRQKFSLDYGATTDYFIYRNGALVRRGTGSISDIEIDISEENYFSNYTVKVIDQNGRIQDFDLYTGLGLLDTGDYSFIGGADRQGYALANAQVGLSSHLNIFGGYVDTGKDQRFIKRAKTSFRGIRGEIGELTNTDSDRLNSYEQAEANYGGFAYIYNHRDDLQEDRDNKQHTFLYTPSGALLQFQHRINDNSYFDNEFLFGKQIRDLFVYARHTKFSTNKELQSINVAGIYSGINYDIGTLGPWETPGVFALINARKGRWATTANVDKKSSGTTLTTRLDYTYKNISLYSNYKQSSAAKEVGVGFIFSFFPTHYEIDLKKQAQTVVVLKVFLDQNGNGILDPEDTPLQGIKGTLSSRNNASKTDQNGQIYFELNSSSRSAIFSFDESSFKEMYYLPMKENIRLDISPRKVNEFDVPIKINAVVLLDCDHETKIKDLKVYHEAEIIYESSSCTTPLVLDRIKPGNYKASFRRGKQRKKKNFVLTRENKYFHDIQFALQ